MSDDERTTAAGGDWRGANPDGLDRLADLLHRAGASDVSGESVVAMLEDVLYRASRLEATAEVSRLTPLLEWAVEIAGQLRANASLLRGDALPAWSGGTVLPPVIDTHAPTFDLKVMGQVEADEFLALAEKEELTEEDLRRMNELLQSNDHHPDFAGYIVDSMGVEGYLRLTQRIDRLDEEEIQDDELTSSLDTTMGNVFNNAFEVPGQMGAEVGEGDADMTPGSPAYQDWVANTAQGQRYQQRLAALQATGGQPLAEPEPFGRGDPRLGYDVALDLLEGAEGQIDEQFFTQTMDHLIELEKDDPSIWSADRFPVEEWTVNEDGDLVPNPEHGWGPENDATDRLLGIGATNNPDAVEVFFDPRYNDNLHYFLGDPGKIIGSGNSRLVTYGDSQFGHSNTTSPGGYPGLNAALEAAATGYSPGHERQMDDPPPSEANARIAETAWNTFAGEFTGAANAEDVQNSRIVPGSRFESLRPALSQIAANYISSIQTSASGYTIVPQGEPNLDLDSSSQTRMLLYELGKDPEAYQAITAANNAYTYLTIDHAVNGEYESAISSTSDRASRAADASGIIAGIMTDARATAVYDEQIAEDEEFNASTDEAQRWTDTSIAMIAGTVGRNPIVSAGISMGGGLISDSVYDTFRADSQQNATTQYNRAYNESLESHRDDVVYRALHAATSREGTHFTEDEIIDLKGATSNGTEAGYTEGTLVGRGPLSSTSGNP